MLMKSINHFPGIIKRKWLQTIEFFLACCTLEQLKLTLLLVMSVSYIYSWFCVLYSLTNRTRMDPWGNSYCCLIFYTEVGFSNLTPVLLRLISREPKQCVCLDINIFTWIERLTMCLHLESNHGATASKPESLTTKPFLLKFVNICTYLIKDFFC